MPTSTNFVTTCLAQPLPPHPTCVCVCACGHPRRGAWMAHVSPARAARAPQGLWTARRQPPAPAQPAPSFCDAERSAVAPASSAIAVPSTQKDLRTFLRALCFVNQSSDPEEHPRRFTRRAGPQSMRGRRRQRRWRWQRRRRRRRLRSCCSGRGVRVDYRQRRPFCGRLRRLHTRVASDLLPRGACAAGVTRAGADGAELCRIRFHHRRRHHGVLRRVADLHADAGGNSRQRHSGICFQKRSLDNLVPGGGPAGAEKRKSKNPPKKKSSRGG